MTLLEELDDMAAQKGRTDGVASLCDYRGSKNLACGCALCEACREHGEHMRGTFKLLGLPEPKGSGFLGWLTRLFT